MGKMPPNEVAKAFFSLYRTAFDRPAVRAAVAIFSLMTRRKAGFPAVRWTFEVVSATYKESKMPKMKTKSSAKKRFKITGSGKVMYAQAGKRHGMIKRTKKQIRNLRGTAVMFDTDGYNVKKFFLPNG